MDLAEGRAQRHGGSYLGTTIGDSWWRRHRGTNLMARGKGYMWWDSSGLYFLRTLTRKPIFLPWAVMTGFELAGSHAGKWIGGRRVIKLRWQAEGQQFVSGFVMAANGHEAATFKMRLEAAWRENAPA